MRHAGGVFDPSASGVRFGQPGTECRLLLRDATDPFRDGSDFVDFVAELHGPGLDAVGPVRSVEGSTGLAAFVRSLAADWRGWQGIRRWDSIEHQLQLEAEHDSRGHVGLEVTLRGSWKPEAWKATIHIRLEAGEELRRLTDELAAFFAVA